MISVIVPYIKDRGFLKQCLASIYAQKYARFEVIEVKNDASVAINVNIGLSRAKGRFFKVVGDDDWLPEDALYNLREGINGHPWVVANAIDVSEDMYEVYKPPTLDFAENLKSNRIHNGGTMYRTEILRAIGGMDESLWTGEEYEMHLRLMSRGILPAYLDKEVYFYRKHPGQKYKMLNALNRQKRIDEIKRIQSLYSDKV